MHEANRNHKGDETRRMKDAENPGVHTILYVYVYTKTRVGRGTFGGGWEGGLRHALCVKTCLHLAKRNQLLIRPRTAVVGGLSRRRRLVKLRWRHLRGGSTPLQGAPPLLPRGRRVSPRGGAFSRRGGTLLESGGGLLGGMRRVFCGGGGRLLLLREALRLRGGRLLLLGGGLLFLGGGLVVLGRL